MKAIGTAILYLFAALATSAAAAERPHPAAAQGSGLACITMNTQRLPLDSRSSPLDSLNFDLRDGAVKVCYGRPSARGREVFGGLVPYGKLWRTGANEPTMIHTTVPLQIAGIRIEPGSYSIYTVPGEAEWEVVVNASTSQWGHEGNYTEQIAAQEVGRATVEAGATDEYVELFTISAKPAEDGSATVYLEWEETRVVIPISS